MQEAAGLAAPGCQHLQERVENVRTYFVSGLALPLPLPACLLAAGLLAAGLLPLALPLGACLAAGFCCCFLTGLGGAKEPCE